MEGSGANYKSALSLEAIIGFERRILAALEIWNAYREKFAFRMMPEQRQTLALMDDLAWHIYRPARDRAVGSGSVKLDAVRQPPLVFPNPRWSPFARSREQRYEFSEESGNWDALDDLDEWLRALPVPLIGIPVVPDCASAGCHLRRPRSGSPHRGGFPSRGIALRSDCVGATGGGGQKP